MVPKGNDSMQECVCRYNCLLCTSHKVIMHAHQVWKGKVVSVSVPPRPDLRVALAIVSGNGIDVARKSEEVRLKRSMLRPECTRPGETVLGTVEI